MDISTWLARCARLIDRLRRGASGLRTAQQDRAAAKRSLEARLSSHLRKDIGADDG